MIKSRTVANLNHYISGFQGDILRNPCLIALAGHFGSERIRFMIYKCLHVVGSSELPGVFPLKYPKDFTSSVPRQTNMSSLNLKDVKRGKCLQILINVSHNLFTNSINKHNESSGGSH